MGCLGACGGLGVGWGRYIVGEEIHRGGSLSAPALHFGKERKIQKFSFLTVHIFFCRKAREL